MANPTMECSLLIMTAAKGSLLTVAPHMRTGGRGREVSLSSLLRDPPRFLELRARVLATERSVCKCQSPRRHCGDLGFFTWKWKYQCLFAAGLLIKIRVSEYMGSDKWEAHNKGDFC